MKPFLLVTGRTVIDVVFQCLLHWQQVLILKSPGWLLIDLEMSNSGLEIQKFTIESDQKLHDWRFFLYVSFKVCVFWEGHKIWKKSSSYFLQERRILCAQQHTCQKVNEDFSKQMWSSRILQTLLSSSFNPTNWKISYVTCLMSHIGIGITQR